MNSLVTVASRARSIFKGIRERSAFYSGKSICNLNFFIPLYLNEFMNEDKEDHLLLLSWRYASFVTPILAYPEKNSFVASQLNPEKEKEKQLVVLKDNPLSIFNIALDKAREKNRNGGRGVIFAIIPYSLPLLKRLNRRDELFPDNLLLIIDTTDIKPEERSVNQTGWKVDVFNSSNPKALELIINECKEREYSSPRLLFVEKGWEQIVI